MPHEHAALPEERDGEQREGQEKCVRQDDINGGLDGQKREIKPDRGEDAYGDDAAAPGIPPENFVPKVNEQGKEAYMGEKEK